MGSVPGLLSEAGFILAGRDSYKQDILLEGYQGASKKPHSRPRRYYSLRLRLLNLCPRHSL